MHTVDSIGLTVEFDGKKNVVLADGQVTEYPIGGMACEYARLHPTAIKQFILDMPSYGEAFSPDAVAEALMQMYEALSKGLGQLTGIMKDYGTIAFGCSSQGSEQLEESEFEPMETIDEIKHQRQNDN